MTRKVYSLKGKEMPRDEQKIDELFDLYEELLQFNDLAAQVAAAEVLYTLIELGVLSVELMEGEIDANGL